MSERDNDSREPGVHRLVDMVVEEVSLVDRAANKRRYLLVKRSEDVADADTTDTETDTDTDDTHPEADTSETDDDETEDADKEDVEDGDDKKPSSADAVATTAAVVAALEAMSAAVETLATAQAKAAPPKAAPPKKKPPARGGGSTADDDEDESEEEDDEWEEDEEKAPPARRPKGAPKRQAKGDDAFAQMKAAIGLLEGIIGGKSRQAKRAPASIDDVATKLDAVTTTLSDLKKLVGGQGERIGRVEKSFGLPASRPVEDKGKKKGDDDEGWPLDLNTPRDRASVDKAVSFHD